jgi:hypothetical protein
MAELAAERSARETPDTTKSGGRGPARSSRDNRLCFRSSARVGHNAGMAHAPNFKLALTRVIVPTAGPSSGPGAELTTLEDATRFVGLLLSWRQARPHWDFAAELLLKAAETGKRRDVEAATAQMECALRTEGWL